MKHNTPTELFNGIANELKDGGLCDVKTVLNTFGSPKTGDIHTVCIFNGYLYAFSWNGWYLRTNNLTSTNAEYFQSPNSHFNFYRVAASDSCMIGYDNVEKVLYKTTDGISWTRCANASNSQAGSFNTIKYVNGRFVALFDKLSSNNQCLRYLYSTDGTGTTWTWGWGPIISSSKTTGIAYGNGKYVLIFNSPAAIYYSTNLSSWSQIALPSGVTTSHWFSDIDSNGSVFAISAYNSKSVYISGTTAYAYNSPSIGNDFWHSIRYCGSYWAINGQGGAAFTQSISTSSPTWSISKNDVAISLSDGLTIAYGVVGNLSNVAAYIAYVTDTYQKTLSYKTSYSSSIKRCLNNPYSTNTGLSGAACSNSRCILPGYLAYDFIFYTDDGKKLKGKYIGNNDQWRIPMYGNGKFVIINYAGTKALYSVDNGENWTVTNCNIGVSARVGCFGNGRFIVIPDANTTDFYYSSDGITYSKGTLPASGYKTEVCYVGNKFFILSSGTIQCSTDGVNWTAASVPSGYTKTLYGVAYSNGKYAVVTYVTGLPVLSSTDGLSWSEASSGFDGYRKNDISGNDDMFVMMIDIGICKSTDLVNWTVFSNAVTFSNFAMNKFNNAFILLYMNSTDCPFIYSWNSKFLNKTVIKADDFADAVLEYGGHVGGAIDQETLKHDTYGELFSDIADAIREIKGTSEEIIADDFPDVISTL